MKLSPLRFLALGWGVVLLSFGAGWVGGHEFADRKSEVVIQAPTEWPEPPSAGETIQRCIDNGLAVHFPKDAPVGTFVCAAPEQVKQWKEAEK